MWCVCFVYGKGILISFPRFSCTWVVSELLNLWFNVQEKLRKKIDACLRFVIVIVNLSSFEKNNCDCEPYVGDLDWCGIW